MSDNLGSKLKELRKASSLTAKEVSVRLKEAGFEISDKTISGYETGIRMPNADVFMALCEIYDCKNILETFKDIKVDYSIPSDSEWKMIEKYRFLDPHGSKVVDLVLDAEYARCKEEDSDKVLKFSVERETGKIVARNGSEITEAAKQEIKNLLS